MADDLINEIEDLKKLSPEERIEKLKKIQEKKQKEIEEARKLLAESVDEFEEETEQKSKIPIDQLKVDTAEMLLTLEDREMFTMKRFLSERALKDREGDQKRILRDRDIQELEKMLQKERIEAKEQQVEEWEKRLQEQRTQQQAAEAYTSGSGSRRPGAGGAGTDLNEVYRANPSPLQLQLEYYANEVQEMYKQAQESAGLMNQSTMDRLYQIQARVDQIKEYRDLNETIQDALQGLDRVLTVTKYNFKPV